MGCGASKYASVTVTDTPVKGLRADSTAPSKGEPLPTPKKPLPSHLGMLKPSGAAGTSSTAAAAGTAHPASLRTAHPASLSRQAQEPAQDQGSSFSGSSAGNPKRKSSRRGASFSQSIINKLGKDSIVGQVIGRASELVEDATYNIDAIISIQKMWRSKEASERVERMRVEVEVTNEAEVRTRPHSQPAPSPST